MARKVNRRLIHGELHFILVYSESHQSSCKSTKPICFKKVTEPGQLPNDDIFIYDILIVFAPSSRWFMKTSLYLLKPM